MRAAPPRRVGIAHLFYPNLFTHMVGSAHPTSWWASLILQGRTIHRVKNSAASVTLENTFVAVSEMNGEGVALHVQTM